MSSIAVARGLQFKYGRRTVFEHLDLNLPAGITGLLGPNGAGKSTLFNLLATLTHPTGGSLEIMETPASRPSDVHRLRQQIGYLPQSFGYYPSFTVREFVEYAGWLKRVPRRSVRAQALQSIEDVGLGNRQDSKLKSLSGGMLQRAGIAHALVHRPQLLILDEPTGGLDPHQRVEFRELLRSIAVDASVLISTHLVEDVAAVCGHIVVLHEGTIAFEGDCPSLVARGATHGTGDTPLERGYTAVLQEAGARPRAIVP